MSTFSFSSSLSFTNRPYRSDPALCFSTMTNITEPPLPPVVPDAAPPTIPQTDGSGDPADGNSADQPVDAMAVDQADPHASRSEHTAAQARPPPPTPALPSGEELKAAEGESSSSSSSSRSPLFNLSSEESSDSESQGKPVAPVTAPTSDLTPQWPSNAILEDRLRKILDTLDRAKPVEEQEHLRNFRREAREALRKKVKDREQETWSRAQRNAFILEVQRCGPGLWEIIKQRANLDKSVEALAAFWDIVSAEAGSVVKRLNADGVPYVAGAVDFSRFDFSVFKTAEQLLLGGKETEAQEEIERLKGTTSADALHAWLTLMREFVLQAPRQPKGSTLGLTPF